MTRDSTTSPSLARGQARGAATRQDIIRVARNLFSQHGYHRTGIADIQEATGLTKGAFYHHFRTKEELALAVLDAARADYAEHWFPLADSDASPARRLADFLDGIVALNARPEWTNCRMIAILASELTPADEPIRSAVAGVQAEAMTVIHDLIAGARETGEVDDHADPAVWTQLIVSTLVGTLVTVRAGSARIRPDAVVEFIKQWLLKKHEPPGALSPAAPRRERTPQE